MVPSEGEEAAAEGLIRPDMAANSEDIVITGRGRGAVF